MKTLTFIGLGAAMLLAACSQRPSDAFTLTGNIDAPDNTVIQLLYEYNDSMITDSAVIVNGQFTFNGTIEHPTMAALCIGDVNDWRNCVSEHLYIEPADMTVDALTATDFKGMKVTGSRTQAEVDSLNALLIPLSEEIMTLREATRDTSLTKEQLGEMTERMGALRDSAETLQTNFIKTHPGSYYTAYLLKMSASKMSYEELRSAYDALTPEIKAVAAETAAELAALESIQPGKVAPDVVGVNQNGDSIKMSDLRGKVVLLDFWATWCVPCRQSFPHVKEVYNKYHDKGLEVFCVGDNDSNPDAWKEVIVSDGLENYHHVLRGLKTIEKDGKFAGFDKSNDQSEKYAVHYIPSKFLIAADGTMIGRFDDEKELDAKLAEIFNN